MEYKQIEAFLAIVEQKNITKAADPSLRETS